LTRKDSRDPAFKIPHPRFVPRGKTAYTTPRGLLRQASFIRPASLKLPHKDVQGHLQAANSP
jgi:hypothetical protein